MDQAFLYCLIHAASKTGVSVLAFIQMSNHLHDVIHDPEGLLPKFNELFHGLLAKCGNAIRDRTESFFSSDGVSCVHLESRQDVIDRIVYCAMNPVRAGLVERATDWPGATSYLALITGQPITAKRPAIFSSRMADEVSMTLTIPSVFGDADQFRRDVQAAVEAAELMEAAKRTQPVCGAKAVMDLPFTTVPENPRKRGSCKLSPRFAAKNEGARKANLVGYEIFVKDHEVARKAYDADELAVFPYGTYFHKRYKRAFALMKTGMVVVKDTTGIAPVRRSTKN